ncbi:MAG: peptidoglycan-binding protein, partial [Ilumatobacteraceae bacterium]
MIRRLLAASLLAATTVSVTPLLDAPQASAVTCTVTVRIKPGAVGTPVRCLEQRLRELGMATGPVDTVYDATSVRSVKRFQVSRGLYADGLVTSITGRQLGLRGALPPAGTTKITVLGDSTSAAMRWYDEARNETTIYDVMGRSYDLAWSIESCKRLWAASCYGRLDPGTGFRWTPRSVLPEMQTTLKGRLGDAIVIMAGYDDFPSIADDIDAIVSEAERQGVSRVFWLTYRTTSAYRYGTYYRQHNAALAAAQTKHPNLVVLDWNVYTHLQSAATQDAWFEADGVHMTRAGGLALARFLKSRVDASDVRACTVGATRSGTPATAVGVPPAPSAPAAGYHPLSPVRAFDSRLLGTGKVGARRMIDIDLSSSVPPEATSAALSVTAVGPCGRGHVSVYACGVRPNTSSLNYEGGRSSSGNAISLLAAQHVCVYTSTATDITVDVTGWFGGADGDTFHPVDVRRWLDTRTAKDAVVPTVGVIANGGQLTLPVAGTGTVPSGATAAWLNVTAVTTGSSGSLTVYPGPCGSRP